MCVRRGEGDARLMNGPLLGPACWRRTSLPSCALRYKCPSILPQQGMWTLTLAVCTCVFMHVCVRVCMCVFVLVCVRLLNLLHSRGRERQWQ